MFDAQTDAFLQGRCRQVLSGAQVVSGLTEDPGVGEGAAADHDTVAADGEHPVDVFGRDDVAVADDGDLDHFFDLFQPMPIRLAGVSLAARAAMDRVDRRADDLFKTGQIFKKRGPVPVRDMVLDPAAAVDVDEIRAETLRAWSK